MKVFLSWSGERSKSTADALCVWLRQVIQSLEPWISTEIGKGTRWGAEIAQQLEHTKVGIICLTTDNLDSPWLHFEAGALSKTKDATVCTFLLDVDKTDVKQPLAQFQHTAFVEEEVRQLVRTLNGVVASSGDRSLEATDVDEVFELFWPRLRDRLTAIPAPVAPAAKATRDPNDILREILAIVRSGQQMIAPLPRGGLQGQRRFRYTVKFRSSDSVSVQKAFESLTAHTTAANLSLEGDVIVMTMDAQRPLKATIVETMKLYNLVPLDGIRYDSFRAR